MSRTARLVRILASYPASRDVRALAVELGVSEQTVRRDLRDLRESGAELPPPRGVEALASVIGAWS